MPIDLRRPLLAALEAALEDLDADTKKRKRRGGAGRALLVGAGLATAGRWLVQSRGREMVEALQHRFPLDQGDSDQESAEDEDEEFDEPEDEQDADESEDEQDADEPEAEEDADEPQAEEDVDEAEGQEAEGDGDEDQPAQDEDRQDTPRQRPRRRTAGRSRR